MFSMHPVAKYLQQIKSWKNTFIEDGKNIFCTKANKKIFLQTAFTMLLVIRIFFHCLLFLAIVKQMFTINFIVQKIQRSMK